MKVLLDEEKKKGEEGSGGGKHIFVSIKFKQLDHF